MRLAQLANLAETETALRYAKDEKSKGKGLKIYRGLLKRKTRPAIKQAKILPLMAA